MSPPITGLILAGGAGRRMDGSDKGLQILDGEPLVKHVLDRLAPQVGSVLISANRNLARYGDFGCPVLPDRIDGFAGPLAGIHAALCAVTTPLLATVPCDSPFLPADLVARLRAALEREGAGLAVVRCGDRVHHTFALLRRELEPALDAFLSTGGRSVRIWHASLGVAEVDFDDEAAAFENINTAAELAALQDGRHPP